MRTTKNKTDFHSVVLKNPCGAKPQYIDYNSNLLAPWQKVIKNILWWKQAMLSRKGKKTNMTIIKM